MRCKASTRSGKRCKSQALAGGERCYAHSAAAVGRPDKLTDELKARLLEAVRAGVPVEVAAEYAGISRSTYYRWLSLAEEDDRFRAFRDEVRTAEAEAEVHATATLRKAMGDDWRAALAYLERRHPERWGRRRAEELTRKRRRWGERADDIDVSDRKTRRLLSEVLRRRPAAR
jgi:transposase